MKTFALIVILAGNTEYSYKAGVGGVSVHDFQTKELCEAAGKAFIKLSKSVIESERKNQSGYVCVQNN